MTVPNGQNGSVIDQAIESWHAVLRGEADLDEVLHKDCVFWSPVLFRPQEGRELTKLYLTAAYQVFPGDPEAATNEGEDPTGGQSGFRYTRRILDGNHAALEFETTMDGVTVNGWTSSPVTTTDGSPSSRSCSDRGKPWRRFRSRWLP